ncbi:MAG: hypothetical protein ACLPQS_01005 [Acidimicrobiales bacterium]
MTVPSHPGSWHREHGRRARLLSPVLVLGGLALTGGTATTAGTFSAATLAGQALRVDGVTVTPHKGILPPKNPSKSLPPKPNFLASSTCSGAKDTTACNDLVLSATSNARKVLEKLGPMSFSLAAYEKLSGVEQLFVTVNVERVDRGLAPMLELTKSLDSLAQAGAKASTDPDIRSIIDTKLPGGGLVISAGANFASGYGNPLGSNYGWMYDDGLGSANGDCTSKHPQGCWGHRDNILHTYGSTSICDAMAFESVMGAGYVKSGAIYGDGETEVLVGVCGKTPTDSVVTWTKVKSLLHIK